MLSKNVGALSPESVKMCVLYDATTGVIFHAHQVLTYPGGRKLNDHELETRAREVATKVGKDASKLKTLHIEPSEYKPGFWYSVDLKSIRLVGTPVSRKPGKAR